MQGAVPSRAFENLLDLVILGFVVALKFGAEQAGMDARRGGIIAAADVGMAHVQLANHFTDDVGEVGPMIDVGDQRFVLVVNRLPIDPVHARVEEEVAHLPPAFVVDLLPFLAAIELHVHPGYVQRFTDADRTSGQINDGVLALHGDKHLLLIGGDLIAVDIAKRRFLARVQVVVVQYRVGIAGAGTLVIENAAGPDEMVIVGRLNRQAQDAVLQTVGVHLDRRAFFFRWINAGGGLIADAHFIVAWFERRLGLLGQRHKINSGQILIDEVELDLAIHGAEVAVGNEEEVLAVRTERRLRRTMPAVGDIKCLVLID